MESQLGNFECKRGIKQRWMRDDKKYLDAQRSSLVENQQSLSSSLRAAIVRRHYLLKLNYFRWCETNHSYNYSSIYSVNLG